jgi:ketosteroid isomerase-like protein
MDKSKWLGALGLACGLALAPAAGAQEVTTKTLVDRAQIEDLLTRYYNNFGNSKGQSFAAFYADDAELVLGANSYKGKEGIEGVYKAAAGAATPQRKSFAFNIILSNVLVVVHGDTATARALFTETIVENKGDAPKILTQGREFDTFVKTGGTWKIKKRQITGPEATPDWWKD